MYAHHFSHRIHLWVFFVCRLVSFPLRHLTCRHSALFRCYFAAGDTLRCATPFWARKGRNRRLSLKNTPAATGNRAGRVLMIEDAARMRTMAECQHEDEGLLTLRNPNNLVRLLCATEKTSPGVLFPLPISCSSDRPTPRGQTTAITPKSPNRTGNHGNGNIGTQGNGNNDREPGKTPTPHHSLTFRLLSGDRPVDCTLLPICPCALR